MAGDWIKMRNDLPDDPAVIAIASKLDIDEFSVIGRLHALWAWADEQSRDGHASGVTQKWLDRKVQCDGFAAALVSVKWLEVTPEGLTIPNFENHNGETAKVRALGTRRKQRQRANPRVEIVPPVVPAVSSEESRVRRDKSETREEKRREEIRDTDAIASAAAKTPRASRKCPNGFEPTEPDAWIAANAPGVDWKRETEIFRDHTFKNAISDWNGCWRNWMRKAAPATAQRGFMTAKERDTANAAEWVRKSTGGLLDRAFPSENVIDMEAPHAAQIGNR